MVNINQAVKSLSQKDNNTAYECLKYLLSESEKNDNVYPFMDVFINMLENENSYIRTRAIMLISANARWDSQDKINKIIDNYLKHITDVKPITARQCVKSLFEIAKHKPDLRAAILKALCDADVSKYKDTMGPLLQKDIQQAIKSINKIV